MKTIYNNKLKNSVSGKRSFSLFSRCSSLAAVAMLAMLAASCQSDDSTAPTAGGTPLGIGTLSVQGTGSETKAGTRAYTDDSYTSWQWAAGEEIIVTAYEQDFIYTSTYVLGSDGTTWAIKAGSTMKAYFDGSCETTYPDAIYTQDVDGGDYRFAIESYGGIAESTFGNYTATLEDGCPLYTDQSTKTRYQGTDRLAGSATLGEDHLLSATLLHQSVDVAIIVKRGIGWGSTEEAARTAFLAHIKDKAAPKIPTNNSTYAVSPFCSYKNGDEAVYRAHIPVSFFHRGSGSVSLENTMVNNMECYYLNGTLVNSQILKLTHVTGAELTATFNLTSNATSGIMQGKRLTVTITYDNIAGLSTQGVSLGNWTTVNGGEMDGNYIGTVN